MLDASFMLLCK